MCEAVREMEVAGSSLTGVLYQCFLKVIGVYNRSSQKYLRGFCSFVEKSTGR